jgi:hypothetical protein
MTVVNINLNNVQETLVSGTNIKTINGVTILGAGDLEVGLGRNDQVITDTERVITLSGDTDAEMLTIKNDSLASVVAFQGDKGVRFYGMLGINVAPSTTSQVNIVGDGSVYGISMSSTNSGAGYRHQGTGGTTPFQFLASKVITTAFHAEGSVSGTANRCGFDAEFITTNSGDNVCFRANAVNAGAGEAVAIDIVAGYIKTNAGTTTWDVGGVTSADNLTISGLEIRGDDSVSIPTGVMGIGATPNSTRGLSIVSGTDSSLYIEKSQTRNIFTRNNSANGKGVQSRTAGTTGTNYTFFGQSNGTNVSGTNVSAYLESNGALNNYALWIAAGNIRVPSGGIGQSITLNYNGVNTGEVLTATYEEGILISHTEVP